MYSIYDRITSSTGTSARARSRSTGSYSTGSINTNSTSSMCVWVCVGHTVRWNQECGAYIHRTQAASHGFRSDSMILP